MQPAPNVEPPAPVREALIESVPILIGRVNAEGVVQETEGSIPHAEALGGIVPDESNLLEIFPDNADEIRATLDGGDAHIEVKTGGEKPAYFELRIISDRKRGTGAYFSIHDTTEMRQLQLALLDCTDHEQMRVGQELHDTLGQELTGISYQLQALEDRAAPELKDAIWKLQDRIASSLRQARDISFTLTPQIAGEDICSAFGRLCAHLRATFRIECIYTPHLDRRISDNGVAFHLFRIAQEACTNAVRHAEPKRIEIRLTTGAQNILEIENDGLNLTASGKPDFPGLGVPMMKFRAKALSGSLRLAPREPSGTIVRCHFENKAAPDAEPPCDDQPCPTCL